MSQAPTPSPTVSPASVSVPSSGGASGQALRAQPTSQDTIRTLLTFPDAEQPDIVRSFQKDDYYRKYLGDQLFDLINRFFGGRIALQNQAEARLVSDAAYLLLQTGVCKNTLGEEYCDIMQIAAATGKPPSIERRNALVAVHVLVPYLWQKLSSRLPSRGAAEGESQLRVERGQLLGPQSPPSRLASAWQRVSSRTRAWLVAHFGTVTAVVTFLLHLHLALFYFQGRYYQLAKRALGVTYKFTRRIGERRPSYQILGLLIMIQLFVSTVQAARERLAKLRTTPTVSQPLEQRSESLEEVSAHKCALCLSERRNTAATACGHLFCWDCITEWCNTKAECPLCRQPVQMQALTAIYHY